MFVQRGAESSRVIIYITHRRKEKKKTMYDDDASIDPGRVLSNAVIRIQWCSVLDARGEGGGKRPDSGEDSAIINYIQNNNKNKGGGGSATAIIIKYQIYSGLSGTLFWAIPRDRNGIISCCWWSKRKLTRLVCFFVYFEWSAPGFALLHDPAAGGRGKVPIDRSTRCSFSRPSEKQITQQSQHSLILDRQRNSWDAVQTPD